MDGDDGDHYEPQAKDLTYIDTTVFLAYLLGNANDPKQYPLAKDFFIALANSKENQGARKRQGILSILFLIEILAALRGQKTKEFELLKSITSETERTEYVISEAKIPQIQYMGSLNIDVNNLLYSTFITLSNIRDSIKFLNLCPHCGTKRTYKFLAVHKIVGSIDIIHVLLAKELKCNEFVTLDHSFEEIKMYMRPLK